MYFIDVKGTTQENLAEEVLEIARRRLGPDAEFKYEVMICHTILFIRSTTLFDHFH